MTNRRTRRWTLVHALAFALFAVGIYFGRPDLLLASAVGVVFAAYPHVTADPTVDVEIERRLEPTAPAHGDRVTVTVEVTNVGDETLVDLRLVDGVPSTISVSSGTPRHTAALAPGSSTTVSYEVSATHGVHRFEAATVLARDPSGGVEVETTVEVDTELVCLPAVESPTVATQDLVPGPVAAGRGSGVEFARVRQYRRGDAPPRIDWRRFVRTGDLATVSFRDERRVPVVCCLDARESAYRRRSDDEPHAVCFGVAALLAATGALLEDGHRVGLAALGREPCWLAPGEGADRRGEIRHLLRTHPAFETTASDDPHGDHDEQAAAIEAHLADGDVVVLCSPLTDDVVPGFATRLRALGHPVTVVCPDVATDASVGGTVERLERASRVDALREAGVRVVEWTPGEPLAGAGRRWSR